jgi:hypothetical protein
MSAPWVAKSMGLKDCSECDCAEKPSVKQNRAS